MDIRKYFKPIAKEDAAPTSEDVEIQLPSSNETRVQQHNTPVSSLEIDESPAESSSDEHSSEDSDNCNDSSQIQSKRTQKFNSMNLSKFKICRRENKEQAEKLIEKCMTRIGKKFTKTRKRKMNRRQIEYGKKRRSEDNQHGEPLPSTSNDLSTQGHNEQGAEVPTSELESDGELVVSNTTVPEVKELTLKDSVRETIDGHPSGFRVRLYVLNSPSLPEMYTTVRDIIRPEQMAHYMNTISSFILFFYKDGNDGPDIFVMTSGQGYRYFTQRSCPQFPKKIAKRLLQFKTIELETRNVTGDTRQTRKLFLPNSGGTINIWDLIDVVVHKYRAYPREDSSVFNLDCFKTKKGKKKEVSFSIKRLSLVVNQSSTLSDMQEMIHHFSEIDKKKSTKLYNSNKVEEEDAQFDQMEFIQEEHKKNIKKQLNVKLQKRIQAACGGTGEDIPLSLANLEDLMGADKFLLYLKRKQKPIKIWEGTLPLLSTVVKEVQKAIPKTQTFQKTANLEWLSENVKIAVEKHSRVGKRSPITKFLVGAFITSGYSPYFLWHGKWLKIQMEYQSIVAENYESILQENSTNPEKILLLPWEISSKDLSSETKGKGRQRSENSGKRLKTQAFLPKTLSKLLDTLSEKPYTGESVRLLLKEISDVKDDGKKITCEYHQDVYHLSDKDQLLAMIFLRLHSKLDEGMYNETYILLDKLLDVTSPTQQLDYIVGDRILTNNIEMFDILMYNGTHTYLIHVKEGYDHHLRDVCSQIRNSADLLLRDLTSQSTQSNLDVMWDMLCKGQPVTSKGRKGNTAGGRSMGYGEAIREKVSGMSKEQFKELFCGERQIVYVLASRDTRKGDRKPEEHDSIKSGLQRSFGPKSSKILKLLTEQEYLKKRSKDNFQITDKFRIGTERRKKFSFSMKEASSGKQQQIRTNTKCGVKPKDCMMTERDEIPPDVEDSSCNEAEKSPTGIKKLTSSSIEKQNTYNDGTEDQTDNSDSEASSEDEFDYREPATEETDTSSTSSTDAEDQIDKENSDSEASSEDDFDYRELATEEVWKKVYDFLKNYLPQTKSTIAQLEILSLFSHFRSYQIGQKKFQLKICFLSKNNTQFGQAIEAIIKR